MKMSQKRTCEGCRGFTVFKRCEFGHKILPDKRSQGIVLNYKPVGQCLKPKTNDEYWEATKIHREDKP